MKQEGKGSDVMNKLKQICKDTDKFDKKIAGKEFLLGKYFDGQKTNRTRRPKKYTKSKIEQLLTVQEKLLDKPRTYAFYQPLHQLWQNYVRDLLKNDKIEDSVYLKLLRADFHGAPITVVHSKVDSYIGLQGIVINETLRTFKVVSPQDKKLTLIKDEIVFQVEVEGRFFILNGNCLVYRSIDRTKVKFKHRKAEPMNSQFLTQFLATDDSPQ